MLVTSMKSSSARVAKPHCSNVGTKLSIGLGLLTSAFFVCAEPSDKPTANPIASAGDSVQQSLPQHASTDTSATTVCEGVSLQVLGSGGPELDDGRASASYLLWKDEKANVLVDAGSGSSVQFGASRSEEHTSELQSLE